MYQRLFSVPQKKKRACLFEGRFGLIDLSSGEAAKENQIPKCCDSVQEGSWLF